MNDYKSLSGMISWHYSPFKFDTPSIDKIIENRNDGRTTHVNSYLGLWSCTFPKMFYSGSDESTFGNNIYEIVYKDNVKTRYITIGEFVKYCSDKFTKEDYIQARDDLINDGYDILCVVDKFRNMVDRPHTGEIITLNLDSIKTFKLVDYKDVKHKEYTYYLDEVKYDHGFY